MKHYPHQPDNRLKTLVGKFENLSQNQEDCTFTKSEIILLTDYFDYERFPDIALEVLNYGISKFKKSTELLVRKTRLLIYNFGKKEAIRFLNQSLDSCLKPFQVDLLRLEILIAQRQIEKALTVISALKFKYQNTGNILSEVYYHEALAYEKLDYFDKTF